VYFAALKLAVRGIEEAGQSFDSQILNAETNDILQPTFEKIDAKSPFMKQ
jgi:hypothetical protein